MEFNATFIVAFLSFIVFVFIMNWILYKPIDKIVEKRKNFIDENYNKAQDNKDRSQSILKDKKEKINSARNSAREEFARESDKIKNEKKEKLSLIKKSANEELDVRRTQYYKEKEEAKESLKAEIVTLAQLVSDKFLKEHEQIEDVDYEAINQIMQG